MKTNILNNHETIVIFDRNVSERIFFKCFSTINVSKKITNQLKKYETKL